MASWLRRFLLKIIGTSVFVVVVFSSAAIQAEEKSSPLEIKSEQLIQPEIDRRDVDLSKIKSEDFEITAFSGLLSVEDFGANSVVGARFAYHVNDDIFIETTYANSKAGQTSYERLSGGLPLLTAEQRKIIMYNISLGYNLLPGESFLTRNTSFISALYIVAGMGSTTFAGADRLTLNIGGGFRLLATDWMAIHVDVRNHIFNMERQYVGVDKTANNLEVTLGVSVFF